MNKAQRDQIERRIEENGRRPANLHSRTKVFTNRLIGLSLSLTCLIIIVQIPIKSDGLVGWFTSEAELLYLEHYQEPEQSVARIPVTQASLSESLVPDEVVEYDEEAEPEENQVEEQGTPFLSDLPLRRLNGRDVLDFAQEQPDIVGGLGSVYVNIDYPESAREAGIEGRVVVSFIVDIDGRPKDLRVVLPLEESCDSAVVRAIRETTFVAGRQNGEKVPVRLRLPIKFQLIDVEPEVKDPNDNSDHVWEWN